jgi:hypothetical protein
MIKHLFCDVIFSTATITPFTSPSEDEIRHGGYTPVYYAINFFSRRFYYLYYRVQRYALIIRIFSPKTTKSINRDDLRHNWDEIRHNWDEIRHNRDDDLRKSPAFAMGFFLFRA